MSIDLVYQILLEAKELAKDQMVDQNQHPRRRYS
jgi:hypothetical protein